MIVMVIICQLWQTPPSCHKSSQKPPWSPGPVCTPWNQSSPIRTSYLDGGDEVKVLEFVILNKILGGWWVGVIMITVTDWLRGPCQLTACAIVLCLGITSCLYDLENIWQIILQVVLKLLGLAPGILKTRKYLKL